MYGLEDIDRNIEQTEGFREGDAEGLSQADYAYLDEAFETRDSELIVDRIDEMFDCRPPKAIDSYPEISDKVEPIKDQIDSKYLEAPNDMEQVEQISEKMTEIEGTRFEDWKNLTPQERLEAMQKVENAAAEVAHRPACMVNVQSMEAGQFGYYNPRDNTITLNSNYLEGDYESYKETLDTIIHEGRHAYQHYNVEVRQVHPSDGDCKNWDENLNEVALFPEYYGYQVAEEVGPLRYWMQPVEADARAFATDVFNQLNKMA